jgi:cytochrome c-type biogenesis protein CcmF
LSDIGLYCLRFALVVALLGLGAGLQAGLAGRAEWTRVAERTVYVVFGFLALATLALLYALATHDFQLAYVARHSARDLPLLYRLTAMWGGQDGWLMLWALLLTGFASAAVRTHRRSSHKLLPWVVVVAMVNALFFLVLINFVSVPFEKLPSERVLSDGMGLSPLLQHPLMTARPLALVAGFAGFSIPFAFCFAALITGELGTTWLRTTRRWALFAWTMLTLGLILGGLWAYQALGSGSYWSWDPAENAALMPWLAGTAYLHSAMVQDKRDMGKTWSAVLIGLTFALCLFGAFVIHSGAVPSSHSLTDPSRTGGLFSGYLVLMAGAFAIATAARRRQLESSHRLESMWSREAGFLLQNCLLVVLLGVVFVGTLWPVFSESLGDGRVRLGPPYFHSWAGPPALLLLFLMGAVPVAAWRRTPAISLLRRLAWPTAASLGVGLAIAVGLRGDVGFWPLGCWVLSTFALLAMAWELWRTLTARARKRGETRLRAATALLRENRRRFGGTVIHLGVVCTVLGFSGAAFHRETRETLSPDQSAQIGAYRLEYQTATAVPTQHYEGARVRLALYREEEAVGVMLPERREYWLNEQSTSIPSIHSRLHEDLYVSLTALESDGSATLEIHLNPLVSWVWIGGVILTAGCVVALWPRPRRERET